MGVTWSRAASGVLRVADEPLAASEERNRGRRWRVVAAFDPLGFRAMVVFMALSLANASTPPKQNRKWRRWAFGHQLTGAGSMVQRSPLSVGGVPQSLH